MFEVYDKRRCEVLGQTRTKAEAVQMGAKALEFSWPSRRIGDLVIRQAQEPPVKTTLLPGFTQKRVVRYRRK
ncbi:MAG: hypothetical protein CBC91_06345 [Rickettsiales bacterium TMED131]|nr:MAG: hypothetical protein CBC91_06345 [Rickettsiales bacterium TMED131]